MNKLRFYITEYVDGNYCVGTNHMHYAFRDDLNFDDFAPEKLPGIMREITRKCKIENIEASFIMV